MGKLWISIGFTLIIIYVVPFLVYSIFSIFWELKPPEGISPARFLISIFLSKIGTAITFVLIFYLTRNTWSGQWWIYAF
jgi:hypothetical protein